MTDPAGIADFVQRAHRILSAEGADAALRSLEPCRAAFGEITYRYLAAPFAFIAGRCDQAFSGFHYRPIFDRSIPQLKALPLWGGEPLDGRALVWGPPGIGIGAELMHLGFLPALLGRQDFEIACDDRLIPSLRLAFPDTPFRGLSEITPDLAKSYIAQTSVLSLGTFARRSLGSYRRARRSLAISNERTAALRLRYKRRFGRRLLVGVTWKSGNPRAADKNIDPTAWAASVDPLIRCLSLQHAATPAEIAEKTAAGILFDEAIDPVRDIEGLIHQIAAVDVVVTCANTVAHFAGALGKKAYVLVGDEPRWNWSTPESAKFWYNSVIRLPAGNAEQFEQARIAITKDLLAMRDARFGNKDDSDYARIDPAV